jgi:Arc/MetJ family transcription regulator
MRTTVTIDDELLAKAQEITGVAEKSALINAALREVIEADAARRLVLLGGAMPDLVVPARRRRA